MLLAVLRHVDAYQPAAIVEQPLGDLFGQQGLAYARGADEEEYAYRTVFVFQPGARAAYGLREMTHGILLSYHALAEILLQAAKTCHFAGLDALGGDTRHGVYDALDMLDAHLGRVVLHVAAPLGTLLPDAGLYGYLVEPCGCRLLVYKCLDGLAALVARISQRRLQLAYLVRFAGGAYMYARAGFVHDVDRLVGKVAVGYVALRELYAGAERLVGIAHLVVTLVVGCHLPQYVERLFGRGRLDDDLLEPAFECRVALDVLAELVERRGSYGLQIAARQSRFEYVGRVERALRRACTDDRVYLVDEYYGVVRLRERLYELLHALLELAAEFRAGHKRRYVQRIELLARYRIRYVARSHAQRESLDYRAFTHSCLTDKHRVVLLAAREDLYHAVDLVGASYDGVDPSLARQACEIHAELVQ